MPFSHFPHAKIGRVEFIILVAMMTAISALSIDTMLPAFPAMTQDFGLSGAAANHVQWVVYAYTLGFSVAQLFYGSFADDYGRKPVILLGVGIFTLGCVGAVFAPSFYFFLAMRAVQGVGIASMRVLSTTIVRDAFSGEQMSRVMSLIMVVFIIVPIIAPSLGQVLLWVFDWHSIFWALLLYAIALTVWFMRRMPETLHMAYRRPVSWHNMRESLSACIHERATLGYSLASGLMMGVLLAYIGTSEQIFQRDVYALGERFPLMFGAIAATMGLASFVNSHWVARLGMQRMAHGALWLFIMLTSLLSLLVLGWAGRPPLMLFAPLLAGSLFCFSMMMPNYGAIAMEPMQEMAGSASSWIGFFTSLMGALIGSSIGQAFDGTVRPFVWGYCLIGWLTLLVIVWTEKRLPLPFTFTRYDLEPESER